MRHENLEVSSGGEAVETIQIPVYDNVAEAVGDRTEKVILDYINAHVRIVDGNECRNKYKEKRPSAEKFMMKAISLCTPAELAQFVGNEAGLYAFLKSDSIKARVAAKMASEEAANVLSVS